MSRLTNFLPAVSLMAVVAVLNLAIGASALAQAPAAEAPAPATPKAAVPSASAQPSQHTTPPTAAPKSAPKTPRKAAATRADSARPAEPGTAGVAAPAADARAGGSQAPASPSSGPVGGQNAASTSPAAAVPPNAAPPTAGAPSAAAPDVAPPASGTGTEPQPSGSATEPVTMGEQSGATVYGTPPTSSTPYYQYTPRWPDAPELSCPTGYCGPDCRRRCRRNELCTPEGTCEPIRGREGRDHLGLLLRATIGYGYGSLFANKADVREGSMAIGMGIDIGSAVVENLVLRGRIRGAVSYYRRGSFGDNVLFSFGTVGAGVDYYFMPINIYIGGTVSVAGVTRTDEDYVNRSKAGLGLDFDVGKEWWVGNRWGIGLALRATYIDVAPANILVASGIYPDAEEGHPRLRSVHVGLQFSATFN